MSCLTYAKIPKVIKYKEEMKKIKQQQRQRQKNAYHPEKVKEWVNNRGPTLCSNNKIINLDNKNIFFLYGFLGDHFNINQNEYIRN